VPISAIHFEITRISVDSRAIYMLAKALRLQSVGQPLSFTEERGVAVASIFEIATYVYCSVFEIPLIRALGDSRPFSHPSPHS
jgi:hypothetical protein